MSVLPQASVVTCFHTHEDLLEIVQTLHSIVQRTPARLLREIVIVDDSSVEGKFVVVLESLIQGQVECKRRMCRHATTWFHDLKDRTKLDVADASKLTTGRERWREVIRVIAAQIDDDDDDDDDDNFIAIYMYITRHTCNGMRFAPELLHSMLPTIQSFHPYST